MPESNKREVDGVAEKRKRKSEETDDKFLRSHATLQGGRKGSDEKRSRRGAPSIKFEEKREGSSEAKSVHPQEAREGGHGKLQFAVMEMVSVGEL